MKNIVLIAPPAAGKGTMSNLLTDKYKMISISVGQLLRDIDPKTLLGEEIRKCQANRELVNNNIVKEAIKLRLQKEDVKKYGFILDGFPRTIEQAKILEELETELNFKIDEVVYLKVDYDLALKRTLGRLSCPKCKTVYNYLTGYNNPSKDKKCNFCHIDLERRNDDNEDSFKKGFDMFYKEVLPTIEYFKSKRKVIEISANNENALDTFKELEQELNLL